MVLDAKIERVKNHFGISNLDDWRTVRPEWIVRLEGVGPVTLDHIRLYLATRDVTLQDDQTPDFWRKNLRQVRICQEMAESERQLLSPFTIAIDTREQQPFSFVGIAGDAGDGFRPMLVRTVWRSLGNSHGDYAVDGLEGQCAIERKSREDAIGTVLGWGERRERFERELATLAEMPASLIVVEASFGDAIHAIESRGKKSVAENRKIFHRQVLAWQQDFRVPWLFCDSRRLAELSTYRFLARYYEKTIQRQKMTAKTEDDELW